MVVAFAVSFIAMVIIAVLIEAVATIVVVIVE